MDELRQALETAGWHVEHLGDDDYGLTGPSGARIIVKVEEVD